MKTSLHLFKHKAIPLCLCLTFISPNPLKAQESVSVNAQGNAVRTVAYHHELNEAPELPSGGTLNHVNPLSRMEAREESSDHDDTGREKNEGNNASVVEPTEEEQPSVQETVIHVAHVIFRRIKKIMMRLSGNLPTPKPKDIENHPRNFFQDPVAEAVQFQAIPPQFPTQDSRRFDTPPASIGNLPVEIE